MDNARKIAVVILGTFLCAYIILYSINTLRINEYRNEYIEHARGYYEDAKTIDFVQFPLDNDRIWPIYAIVRSDGSIDIVAPYTVNNEFTYEPLAENITVGNIYRYEYEYGSPDIHFEYAIVDRFSDVPNNAIDKIKFKANGKTLYFYIKFSE